MTFTDDDLKRLKEWTCDHTGPCETIPFCRDSFGLDALLARLEAAERIIDAGHTAKRGPAIEAWQKAAGK